MNAWFSVFNAQKAELKFASILAVTTACIVLLIVSWSFLTSTMQNNIPEAQTSTNLKVQTTECPILPQTATPSKKSTIPLKKESVDTKIATLHKVPTSKQSAHKIVLGQGNYFVQVGAFQQEKLARLMLEKIKKKYHYAIIKRKADKHAVWVGPVVTKSDALTLKKHLQRKNNLQGFIVTAK